MSSRIEDHPHGPENAEHELKKAYNCVVECGVTYTRNGRQIDGVNPEELVNIYRHAYQAYRDGNKLAAERWARTAKHLSRAFWHEAKINYLQGHGTDLPFLENAKEEYNLHERSDTTADLLDSLGDHVPPGLDVMPQDMRHYLSRGRLHLDTLEKGSERHELLRAERIKAAHEYGRVLECIALAYEAEHKNQQAA